MGRERDFPPRSAFALVHNRLFRMCSCGTTAGSQSEKVMQGSYEEGEGRRAATCCPGWKFWAGESGA